MGGLYLKILVWAYFKGWNICQVTKVKRPPWNMRPPETIKTIVNPLTPVLYKIRKVGI